MIQDNQENIFKASDVNKQQENVGSRVVILGSSGLAKEIYSVICSLNGEKFQIDFYDASQEYLLSADDLAYLGMGSPLIRADCFESNRASCKFPKLIHPNSSIGMNVTIGSGSFIQSGVAITTHVEIGDGCLINLNSTLGHDVVLGNFSVVNPGATVSGNVTIGKSVLIGANATILENISIGDGARVGAGAVVTRNVSEGETVIGIPARPM